MIGLRVDRGSLTLIGVAILGLGMTGAAACQSGLREARERQIRQALQMYEQTNEKKPAALSDLKSNGVTNAMLICPVTKKPYVYNQTTGVHCTDPPHANY